MLYIKCSAPVADQLNQEITKSSMPQFLPIKTFQDVFFCPAARINKGYQNIPAAKLNFFMCFVVLLSADFEVVETCLGCEYSKL